MGRGLTAAWKEDGVKRYIVGSVVGEELTGPGVNIGMCLEGDEDAVLERIMRIIKTGPAVCWSISTESPFGAQR